MQGSGLSVHVLPDERGMLRVMVEGDGILLVDGQAHASVPLAMASAAQRVNELWQVGALDG